MEYLKNQYRGVGLGPGGEIALGEVVVDPTAVKALWERCPKAHATPLVSLDRIAERLGIGALLAKDERTRMGLGSFKALGAGHALAKHAVARGGGPEALEGRTFCCASAGNHGLAMAAAARVFGADAVVFLAEGVPGGFAERLAAEGAAVVRAGAHYEASLDAAEEAAIANGWKFLPDGTWPGEVDAGRDVMEGYLLLGVEMAAQSKEPPTHVFVQAGVGGLAAGVCAGVRHHWGRKPKVVVVEPERAPTLFNSVRAGYAAITPTQPSAMGRLECAAPSHLALGYLAREADAFMTITEADAADAATVLGISGLETTPSGAAGLAGAIAVQGVLALTSTDRVLIVVSECPEDGPEDRSGEDAGAGSQENPKAPKSEG